MDTVTAYVLGVATGLILLPILWLLLRTVGPWITAHASGANVPFLNFLGMRFRGADPEMVITLHIVLTKMGQPVPIEQIEAHYLGLPSNQRNADALLRAVRPDLAEEVARRRGLQNR